MRTFSPVAMSTQPAGSFCLYCFWPVVRHLWSLHMSLIPHHMDLHRHRNVYLTCWFSFFCVSFARRWDICPQSMCLESPITQTSTLVGTSTQAAYSFCLYCFWQAVRCLWSLHMTGIPHHMDLHPDRNVYLTSWFILSVFFLTGGKKTSTPVGTSTQPADSFCLYCFWLPMRCLWSLYMSGILHHTDFDPSRNVYLTDQFILTVLYLTGGEKSVVPTHVRDPPSHRPPAW